jgi:hypothetical protein
MLFYPAALPLSRQTLDYTAGIIRRHRRRIGSCWRKLDPGRQALLVLAYLRKGETFAELAAGARKLAELLRLTCLGLAGQHLYTLRWRNYRSRLVFWLGWLETAVAYLRRRPAQAFSACQRGKRHVPAGFSRASELVPDS